MIQYIKNVLIWLDQGVNVIVFRGYPDQTLSARAWRHAKNGERIWLQKLIDSLLFFDPNHCEESYKSQELKRQLPPEYRE